jgi:hypothetical protein
MSRKKQRVLIVDDEADIALILKLQLEGAGYETMRARDGLEALDIMEREPLDLVLLDIRMPRMDGIDLLRRMGETGIDLAVIVMTAHGSERIAVDALQRGAIDYVSKPFSTEEILGKVERAIAFHRTRRENLRLQEEIAAEHNLLEAVIQGMADLLVVADQQGRVLLLNRAAEELFGISRQEAIGRSVTDVIPADIPAEQLPSLQALSTGKPCLDAGYTILGRSRQVPVLASATPLRQPGGPVRGSVELLRDISARKALEREKEDFVSMLSHDLKTPITAIVGSIDLVREGRLGPLNDEQKEFLDTAVESCADMVDMIDTLLDIHKFEAGMMKLKATEEEVYLLVERAVYGLRAAAEKKGVSLQVEVSAGLPTIMVDRGKVIRLIANLVANAVKFTPAGGVITVAVEEADLGPLMGRIPRTLYGAVPMVEAAERCLAIRVTDTGVGIPSDALTSIFDRFVQARNRREGKTQGTGLGLAFCRKVMDAHAGFIWAESALGQGSRFTALFPLRPR